MRQVLFYIPLHSLWDALPNIPLHSWGALLCVAFVLCLVLAMRLARREGIAKELIQDVAAWVLIGGVVGARVAFMIQFSDEYTSFWDFFKLWHGGMVFYGGFIGAVLSYYIAYFLWIRKRQISNWKMADVVAPCAALGLALGRIGCLLNGCCYGNVACEECPAIHFPVSAAPMEMVVKRGYQSVAGFTLEAAPPDSVYPTNIVRSVEPGSPADRAGLKPRDKIVRVNGKDVGGYDLLNIHWPRGETAVEFLVARDSAQGETTLSIGPLWPQTIGIHPTQIYETISMVLLLFFLLSYYPFKRRDGLVMVFFMLGYGVHRFLDEMLRTDTEKVAFDMTLSQNISIIVLIAAIILAAAVWLRGPKLQASPA